GISAMRLALAVNRTNQIGGTGERGTGVGDADVGWLYADESTWAGKLAAIAGRVAIALITEIPRWAVTVAIDHSSTLCGYSIALIGLGKALPQTPHPAICADGGPRRAGRFGLARRQRNAGGAPGDAHSRIR